MANIRSNLTLTSPSGSSVSATITKEANSTIDREIALTAGEFVEVFTMDTEGALGNSTPVANSLPDFKQIVAFNTGNAPLEIALKTHLIDDADGLTHAEVYAYPTFFIPVGGYMAIPSPRIISTSGTDTSPESLNYVTDVASRCTPQLPLRATASTATYASRDGKTTVYNLLDTGVTNSNGDVYINNIHGKANHDDSSTAATYVCTDGIVPGTVRVQFYKPAFQEFTFTKNGLRAQSSASTTRLTGNTAYTFKLAVDGATGVDLSFTTHATDVTFGTASNGNGVLKKIQDEIDAHELECDVSLVDGNLRFTSRNAVHGTSAIAITATGSGNDFRDSGIMAASYITTTAVSCDSDNDNNTMWDDGEGNLSRSDGGSGWLDYGIPGSSTAAKCSMYMTGAPSNASFRLSWLHGSTAGGNLSTLTPADGSGTNDETNCLLGVYARAISYSLQHGKSGRKGKLRLVVVDNENYESSNY